MIRIDDDTFRNEMEKFLAEPAQLLSENITRWSNKIIQFRTALERTVDVITPNTLMFNSDFVCQLYNYFISGANHRTLLCIQDNLEDLYHKLENANELTECDQKTIQEFADDFRYKPTNSCFVM